MNERARRLWAGTEAEALGYGGVAAVARATGMAISTVRKGRDEVRAGARSDDVVKVRRSTGKRPFEVVRPDVRPALETLVDPVTRGDPESPLRWTCKSTHASSAELFAQGIQAIISLIGNTTNSGGLVVRARLDRRRYPTGKKVSAKELRELKIERDDFHGDWNYVIKPRAVRR